MSLAADIPRRLIVAVGGNAIDADHGDDSPEAQKAIAARTAQAMLPLLLLDNQLVITHGNGPQVGKLLLANAIARERIRPLSLDMLVAQTQGATAYILAQAFENALRAVGSPRHVVGLVTQVEVDPADPAFANPTKPVGPFFPEAEAKALAKELGVTVKEDPGRGWRYVVPSPKPKHICDISLAQTLMAMRTVVIVGGGGGVPVVRDAQGCRHGIEAVIDKDLTTAAIANVLGIRDMMILTAVPRVAIHFGKPEQQALRTVSLSQIRHYQAEGHFPPGSMGPKIDAAIRFLEGGGRRAIVTSLETAMPALLGETGTHIVSDADFATLRAKGSGTAGQRAVS
jgi:carbamate kinase